MNRGPIFLILAAILLFVGYNSVFVLNPRKQAIVLRFGAIDRVETRPGIYFKAPLTFIGLESVQIVDNRLLRLDLDDIKVQVSGGKFYEVDAFLTYRIKDPAIFREQISGSMRLSEDRLRKQLDSALRKVYGLRGFEAALSEERSAMMREVAEGLRPAAAEIGIEIADVRILRTDLTQEVSKQTYDRMNAERLAEAERLRARGQEAARRIRARADRQVVETKAGAQRQAEIARGEGEGERAKIFAEVFTKDRDFFEFYRSMNAYTKALREKGTTMVLSPDSEFFKFFNDANGAPSPSSAPAGQQ